MANKQPFKTKRKPVLSIEDKLIKYCNDKKFSYNHIKKKEEFGIHKIVDHKFDITTNDPYACILDKDDLKLLIKIFKIHSFRFFASGKGIYTIRWVI